MRHPHVRFSRRPSKGHGSMAYLFHSHTIRIPRGRKLANWKYVVDWSIDSLSHEYIHSWLYKSISSSDLPKGLRVSNAGLYATRAFDNLRASKWDISPDRAGVHFKAELLERFDYENLYELLSE